MVWKRKQNKQGKKGQVSMEYLLIVGFAFLMLVPLIIIYYTSQSDLNEKISMAQADKIALEIADAVDEVYYQGVPTKKTFKVYMPEGVKDIIIQDNYIKINIHTMEGTARTTIANVTGSLENYPGLHIIKVIAIPGGVNITDAAD